MALPPLPGRPDPLTGALERAGAEGAGSGDLASPRAELAWLIETVAAWLVELADREERNP